MEQLIKLTIDGVSVEVPAGTTVLEAAKKAGVISPTLCYLKDINQIGACRLCVVDTGARSLQADCVLPVSQNMVVKTNTPAILTACIQEHMGVALFCERFLNSAVSLFVTLGLFGTFLGLSMSVSSLTELIRFSNTSEWLGVLDSVGGGLMSALSGMGVAFYTSLVGVACSIFLTILRSILSPEAMRGALEAEMELWLDHRLAPKLSTERARDNSDLINRLVAGMNAAAASMERTLSGSTNTLQTTLKGFNGTVESFNQGVRDFSEFDYNLRGTVERLDVAVRDLSNALRKAGQALERSDRG